MVTQSLLPTTKRPYRGRATREEPSAALHRDRRRPSMRRELPRPGRLRPGHSSRPSRRARRLWLAASGGAALLLATGLVWHTAYATFTVSTAPFGSTWSTGTV